MASSTVSASDLVVVTSGLLRSVVALVLGVSGAGGAFQGAIDVEVVGTTPQLGDDVGSVLWDLVMHGTDVGVPERAAPGDAAPAPRSSGAAGLGISGLYLLGSPSFLPPPINWRQVGDEAESTCS
jgi:hypothetical protein